MIQSKEDYLYYLEADRLALQAEKKFPEIYTHEEWKFERLLRKVEYFMNCKKNSFWMPYIYFLQWRFHRLSTKLGYTIYPNVFGPGLCIAHRGTLIVHRDVRIGKNCRIHTCVNIGGQAGFSYKVPKIGNNVFIGPGAKIFGDIIIADNITIGANAVVNKSFLEPGISIGGVPAKKISDKGSDGRVVKGTDLFLEKQKSREASPTQIV